MQYFVFFLSRCTRAKGLLIFYFYSFLFIYERKQDKEEKEMQEDISERINKVRNEIEKLKDESRKQKEGMGDTTRKFKKSYPLHPLLSSFPFVSFSDFQSN